MPQPQDLVVHPGTGTLPYASSPFLASLAAIQAAFVDAAPFAKERHRIWDAFMIWDRLAQEFLPEARVFINGSFICHGALSAPDDIDLFVCAHPDDYLRLSHAERRQLFNSPLLYGLKKHKPFDVVDSNFCDSTNRALFDYWSELWSQVRRNDGGFDPQVRKGYVEVQR